MKKLLFYVYTTIVVGIYGCFSIQNVYAEQRKNTITFINSGYLEAFYTNKQIANFGIEFLENSNFIFSRLNTMLVEEVENKFLRYIVLPTIVNLMDIQFTFAFLVSYHELGHATRTSALGGFNFFSKKRDDHIEGTSNFFVYLIDGIFSNYYENITSVCNSSFDRIVAKEELSIVFSGGLNNQIYFQEKAFDDIMYRYDQINYSYLVYFLFSEYIYYYGNIKIVKKGSSGDIGRLLEYFEDIGIGITKENFKKSIVTSLLFSQFTYSSLYSLLTLKNSITPLQYKGFIFPDVFPYITPKGISYRIKSAYRFSDDLIFRFGIEFVAYGKSAKEFIFGVNTKLIKDTRLDLLTVFGKDGFNIETTYTIPISKHFNVNLDFDLYSTESLYGERNAYRLRKILDRSYKINPVTGSLEDHTPIGPTSSSYYFGISMLYVF